jgi:hypothetical protein
MPPVLAMRALAISALWYSNPSGISTWMRCSAPVTGLRIGLDRDPRRTAVHVKLEVDRGEDGVEHFGDDQAEDVEKRALCRVLAGENL